jgi:hypothetical protein
MLSNEIKLTGEEAINAIRKAENGICIHSGDNIKTWLPIDKKEFLEKIRFVTVKEIEVERSKEGVIWMTKMTIEYK